MNKRPTCNGNPKGPNRRRTWDRRAPTLVGMLLLGCWLGVGALAQGGAPFVDSAVATDRVSPTPLAELVGPGAPVQRIALPPTVIPLGAFFEEWGPRPTGYVEPLPAGAQPAGAWQPRPDGSAVLRLEFTSADAKGLRVQLRGALDGLELRVYDPDGPTVLGPYTSFPGVWEDGEEPSWWTPTIFGSSLGLEFYQPPGRPTPLPELAAICYLYDDASDEESPLLGNCLMDVTCQAAWANNEARAVGRMNFVDGGQSFLCTGAMLNRNPQDFAPIFMTARHCINNQPAARSLEVHWLFQTPTCNGTPPALNTLPRNNGSLLLKTHRDSDWSLLGLFDPTRADLFLGWDANYWNNNSAATGIHHPRGEFKRIHFGTKDQDTSCFTSDGAVQSNQQWRVTATQGAARRGSSGSPAFDASHRVRGTMSCGPGGVPEPMTCPPNEWKTYGRFDAFFFIGRWYLFQMANPTFADRNFVGDAGEGGDRERGTTTNPFDTVYEATFCVPSGGTVNIRAGNYNERFTLSRPMTLQAVGGVVTIGQ